MEKLHQDDLPFKYGDWGSKYFFTEEKYAFGTAYIKPGEKIAEHAHDDEEEFFYFMEGKPLFRAEGSEARPVPGDAIRVGVKEAHELINDTDGAVRIVFIKIRVQ